MTPLTQCFSTHMRSPDNFGDVWVATNTEGALTLSSIDDSMLKECIVADLASVWGIPMMCPTQLEVCYHLLHPHRLNALVVVNQTGGGKTHIFWTLGVIECGIVLIFIPLLTLSADVMRKCEGAIST
jgi:superfamily II DNA helicase RecQ